MLSAALILLIAAHTFSGKRNSMLFNVYVLNSYLDDVADREELGGILYESVGHLGDVKKTVVVNTDVYEATEVNNVSDSTLKLHIRLQVSDLKNVGGEHGSGSIVTNVSSGLLKLGDYVLEGGLTTAELASELCHSVLLSLKTKERKIVASHILGSELEAVKKLICDCIGLGVNTGGVEHVLSTGDTKEAGTLGERLVTDLGNLKKLLSGLELAVCLSVRYDVLCRGGIDTRNVGKEGVGCGVYVYADSVNAILNYAAEDRKSVV